MRVELVREIILDQWKRYRHAALLFEPLNSLSWQWLATNAQKNPSEIDE
jgi:hypothetical protein